MSGKTTEVRLNEWVAPLAAAATAVHAAISTAAVVTAAITNPDYARLITITGAGSGHAATGNVVINGTDINGSTISDTIALNGNTTVAGVKAFATVTSIDTTGVSGIDANDTVQVGIGSGLGLDAYCDKFSFKGVSGVSSFTFDTATISKNVVTLSASLDGSTDQAIPFYPNLFPQYGRAWG